MHPAPAHLPAVLVSPPPLPSVAERSAVSQLETQLGTVKEAVAREQELAEKLRREASAAAESAARQVREGRACCVCLKRGAVGDGVKAGGWGGVGWGRAGGIHDVLDLCCPLSFILRPLRHQHRTRTHAHTRTPSIPHHHTRALFNPPPHPTPADLSGAAGQGGAEQGEVFGGAGAGGGDAPEGGSEAGTGRGGGDGDGGCPA
jgi:hypothetical protein